MSSRSQSDQLPVGEVNKQGSEEGNISLSSVPPASLSNSLITPDDNPDNSLDGKNKDLDIDLVGNGRTPMLDVGLLVSDNLVGSSGIDNPCHCVAPRAGGRTILEMVLEELKDIKSQMAKVVKIESNTESLAKQLVEVSNKTSEMEEALASNSARLKEVNAELATIKTFMGKQECSINSLKNLKSEAAASTSRAVTQMNLLVEEQQTQVESFKSCAKDIKKDILSEVEKTCQRILGEEVEKSCQKMVKEEIKQVSDKVDFVACEVKEEVKQVKGQVNSIANEAYCNRFKNQAYNNRFNLLIIGLAEDEQKSTRELVQNFFSQAMKISKPGVKQALRIGQKPEEGSQYIRPIVVKFYSIEQRNDIWKNRSTITGENDSQTIRVQADVPKPLREGVKLMYKVVRAAAKAKIHGEARVRNYQLELNNDVFQFSELEKLPLPLRPSTLASPRSEEALAFYTSSSILSNHYPSVFTVGDMTFLSMEQFLAYKKAVFMGNESLMDKARKAQTPVQAKYILNQLRREDEKDWDAHVENITVEGLKAKFQQNPDTYTFLYNTNGLKLGEASKNPRWGIGLELTDENVLDHTKWSETGNLLGRALMKVRGEICAPSAGDNSK